MGDNGSLPTYFKDLKIQVIDDQEYMRSLLISILQALGIRNLEAHADAVSAYRALESFEANLILTDWEMEPVDGLKLIRRIRLDADSPNPFVPIVMVTGHNHVDNVMQARNAGANDFLIKPVSAKSVYHRIRSTMEHPQPFVRSATYFGPDRRRRDQGPPPGAAERRTHKTTTVIAA